MKKIRTVLGDIDKEKLGFTYSHEHLIAIPPETQKDRDLELSNYDKSLEELMNFKEVGGETLVESSTLDYGRNVELLVKMAKTSGVNIVATTGFNKHIYFPKWVEEKTIEEIAEVLVDHIENGIDRNHGKAGFIKTGSWYNMIHPLEEKVTRAAARAHLKTGAPIWVHTEAGTMGNEMLDILEEEGADLTKVAIGHSDRNADPYYHLKLAERGAYVQFDGPGKVKYYPDSVRVDLIKNLINNGFLKQLLISGDMGRQSYLHAYGGGPGFRFIIQKFIPRLMDEGISKSHIDTIFIENPSTWLGQF